MKRFLKYVVVFLALIATISVAGSPDVVEYSSAYWHGLRGEAWASWPGVNLHSNSTIDGWIAGRDAFKRQVDREADRVRD